MERPDMMEKYRPALLILVSLVLGVLTWLDNRAAPVPQKAEPTVTAEKAEPQTPEATAEATAEPADSAEPEEDAASEEPPASGNPLASFDKASLENWVD